MSFSAPESLTSAEFQVSGIVAIEEQGEAICAVVNVLEDFHVRYLTDNVIKKWAVDIGIGVQEVYRKHNVKLPPQGMATKQQKQTLLDSVLSASNTAVNNPQTVVEPSMSLKGHLVHALMQKLIIKTTIMSEDSKPKESCVLKHSATCKKLPVHLWNEAITASKETSLRVQLIELNDQSNMASSVEIQPYMDEPPAKWPKNQTIHFLDGHKDSTASHTAAWVKEKMFEASIFYFLQQTIYEVGEDKWAAICSDSTANITLLPEFEQMLLLLKPIIKHFSKSMISTAHLQKEHWVDDNDKTVKAFKRLAKQGPFIYSLWSLEASHANASDVFVFWLAIAVTLEELFTKGEDQTGIPVSLVQCITAILTADPCYPLSDNIMKSVLVAPTIHIPAQIPNMSAKHNKVHELKDPISLLVHEIRAAGVVNEFRCQLEAYFHNEWPFNALLQDGNTLVWWNMLLPHPHAHALAIKIFSVLINSMPDEWTGSKLTWLNLVICNNQNAQTLIDMIQIGQWYDTKAENSRPCKEPYCFTVKFHNINKDLLHAVSTGVKPATDNATPDVDTEHDSEDLEDLLDDVEDDVMTWIG
ncbi:hypothetical protein BDR06DRAFT_973827 [Suillus hirtellus]|nr:hypothetical protein BDR06DRAFT_973827 [Suillus hirtellus]